MRVNAGTAPASRNAPERKDNLWPALALQGGEGPIFRTKALFNTFLKLPLMIQYKMRQWFPTQGIVTEIQSDINRTRRTLNPIKLVTLVKQNIYIEWHPMLLNNLGMMEEEGCNVFRKNTKGEIIEIISWCGAFVAGRKSCRPVKYNDN